MKSAKMLDLIKVQKDLEFDIERYDNGVKEFVEGAKNFVINSNINEIENKVELVVQSLYMFGNPIKNARGIERMSILGGSDNVRFFLKKGTFNLLYKRTIVPVGEILLSQEQRDVISNFVNNNKKDRYNTKTYFKEMFKELRKVDDVYNTNDVFECIIRGIVGGVVRLKTEAILNKNTKELKVECKKMSENFKYLCEKENLLIAS